MSHVDLADLGMESLRDRERPAGSIEFAKTNAHGCTRAFGNVNKGKSVRIIDNHTSSRPLNWFDTRITGFMCTRFGRMPVLHESCNPRAYAKFSPNENGVGDFWNKNAG